MGLRAFYEAAEEVPDAVKDYYAEDGEKWVLDIEGIDSHPKVRGVVTANRENVKKRDAYKAQVDLLEAKVAGLPEDFDPDQWAQFKNSDPAKPDAAVEAIKAQHQKQVEALAKKHQADLDRLSGDLSERDSYIDRTVRDGGLKDALIDIGVEPALMDGALASLRDRVKVQRAEDGNRRALVETDLGEVGVTDFVKEWAASKGKAYLGKPTGPDAPGSRNIRGGAKTISRADFLKMDPAAQQSAVTKDGYTVTD
jgi:hypothetical protein